MSACQGQLHLELGAFGQLERESGALGLNHDFPVDLAVSSVPQAKADHLFRLAARTPVRTIFIVGVDDCRPSAGEVVEKLTLSRRNSLYGSETLEMGSVRVRDDAHCRLSQLAQITDLAGMIRAELDY